MMYLSRALASLLISQKPPKKKFEVAHDKKHIVATEHELEFRLVDGSNLPDQVDVNRTPLLENKDFSTKDVSTKLKISMSAVRDLCRKGKLVATQPKGHGTKWHISPDALQNYMKSKEKSNGKEASK